MAIIYGGSSRNSYRIVGTKAPALAVGMKCRLPEIQAAVALNNLLLYNVVIIKQRGAEHLASSQVGHTRAG